MEWVWVGTLPPLWEFSPHNPVFFLTAFLIIYILKIGRRLLSWQIAKWLMCQSKILLNVNINNCFLQILVMLWFAVVTKNFSIYCRNMSRLCHHLDLCAWQKQEQIFELLIGLNITINTIIAIVTGFWTDGRHELVALCRRLSSQITSNNTSALSSLSVLVPST